MSKRYYTVVFEITDEESWKGMGPAFTQSMVEGIEQSTVVPGVQVIACGNGDVMSAYDALSDQCLQDGRSPDEVVQQWCRRNGDSPEEAKLIIG